MARPNDSFYRRIDVRRRYTDLDVVDVVLHRLASQITRAINEVQSSMRVSINDYDRLAGDGFRDDTFSLQVAMDKVGADGGGDLFLPRGTYNITSPIIFNFDNVVLVGEGFGTNLQFNDTTVGAHFFQADTRNRIGLKNLRIEQIAAGAATFAVDWVDCEESYIQEVAFLNCSSCIQLRSCDGIDVSRNTEDNTVTICFRMDDTGVGVTDDIFCHLNNFEAGTPGLTYVTVITGGISPRNVRIENNRPLPVPSHIVPASNLVTRDVLFSAPDRAIVLTGANAVDTIEVTFPNDWRIFPVIAVTPVLNDGTGNLHLAGAFAGVGFPGQADTITLVCDGTNWVETSRSNN